MRVILAFSGLIKNVRFSNTLGLIKLKNPVTHVARNIRMGVITSR